MLPSFGQGWISDETGEAGGISTLMGSSSGSSLMSYAGPIMGIFGAISSGMGAYFSAESTKSNLQFQSDMAAINSRMAERTAQDIMMAGEKQIGTVTMKAGQVKSSQKVSQAARGVSIGEGSAAEEVASTDLIKEMDALTINANAVRQASAARMQSVNAANESLLKGTSADSISPFASMSTSLISGASTVAQQWYMGRQNRLLAAMEAE